jgi:hypothetical protein
MATKSIDDIEDRLNNLFNKAPSLPYDIKNLIVDYGPYLVLVGGILSILSSGLLNFFTLGFFPKLLEIPLYNYYLQIIFNLIASTILVLAFKLLLKRHRRGWLMLFYISLLEIFMLIFTANLSGVLLCFLSFYLLFQVREKYS